MKTHIEKTLSHLYKEYGEYNTVQVNGVLLTFERDEEGLKLFVYNSGDYDCYPLTLDRTSEFPIVVDRMDKGIEDKILGFACQ